MRKPASIPAIAPVPPHDLDPKIIEKLKLQTQKLALALNVVGLMNVQFAIKDGEIFILEVNPRASRTVPFVAKVIGKPIAAIASRIMAGEPLASFNLRERQLNQIAIKEAVFPFARFQGVDPILGPEMRSTGEVMGIDEDYAVAFAKAQLGSGVELPKTGTLFISVKNADKPHIVESVRTLTDIGFKIIATRGTKKFLEQQNIDCEQVNKVLEGRPHIVDAMKNGEVDIVFNTTEGVQAIEDSASLRRTALVGRIPYYTTVAGANAATQAILALRSDSLKVNPIQRYASHQN